MLYALTMSMQRALLCESVWLKVARDSLHIAQRGLLRAGELNKEKMETVCQ